MDDRIVWLLGAAINGFFVVASLAFIYWIDVKKPQKYGLNKFTIRIINPLYLGYFFGLSCLVLYAILCFFTYISCAIYDDVSMADFGGQSDYLYGEVISCVPLVGPVLCRITIVSWVESAISKIYLSSKKE